MASKFSIEAIFKGNDQLSKVMRKISGEGSSFSRRFGADMAKAERSMMKMGEKFKSAGKYMAVGLLAGAGAATAMGLKILKDSIPAWDKQKAAIEGVRATLISTNGAVGYTLEQLEAKASSLQGATFFGDESILQAVTGQMLTFTNITGQSFDRAQMAVLDITAKLRGLNATEGDLQSTTIQLSKALNDPVANLSALSRSGIQFSEVQKKMIKDLVKSGKMMQAQDIILTEIERQYGGTAAALTKTSQGMSIQIKNTIGDMYEEVGKGIDPLRMKFLEFFSSQLPKLLPYIKKFQQFFTDNSDKIFNKIIEIGIGIKNLTLNFIKIIGVINKIKPIIMALIGAWMSYKIAVYAVIVAQNIMNGLLVIGKFLQFIKIIYMIAKAKGIWAAAQWALNFAMSANPIGLIILGITALIAIIAVLVILIVKNWDTIKAVTLNLVNGIVKWFSDMWTMISTGISNFISSAITWFSDMWLTLQSVFTMAGEIISNIMSAVWNGIKTGFEFVFNFIKSYLFTVADTILSTFGNIIKSVMKAVSFVGKSLGIDTSGLEKAIATIDGLQTKVRENSLFSEQGRAKAISGGRDTTKSTRNETVTTNELIVKNESNNRVEFGGKQIGRDFQRLMPSTSR